MFLDAGVTYELRATIADPDGGDETRTTTMQLSRGQAPIDGAGSGADPTGRPRPFQRPIHRRGEPRAAHPLSAVLGFAEVVRDSMPDEDPMQPMIYEVADQSAEMATIIDDLLVAARSGFEAVPTAPKMVNLDAEALAVAETIGPRLRREPAYDLEPIAAFADPIRVRSAASLPRSGWGSQCRALAEIMGGSIDYRHDGQ